MKLLTESVDSVVNRFLKTEGINDKNLFKAVFLAGSGGSGKSFIGDLAFKGTGIRVLNSDQFFEFLLDKFNLPKKLNPDNVELYAKQTKLRTKAKTLVGSKAFNILNGMLPLIVDGTGRDATKVKKQKKILENLGYDTAMIFVDTSLETAKARNKGREREVPEDVLTKAWKDAQANLATFRSIFGSEFHKVDNDKTLDKEEVKDLKAKIGKMGTKLLNAKLRNPVGIKSIAKVKEVKGKLLSDIIPTDDINFKI